MKDIIKINISRNFDRFYGEGISEVDILCFPENVEMTPEEVPGGNTVLRAQKLAEEFSAVILLPLMEKAGMCVYSSTAVIDRDGEFLGKYRRIHLSLEERKKISIGDMGFPVFQTEICRVGITMSRDIFHPEAFRILSIDGADIVFNLSNSTPSVLETLLSAHSLMNSIVLCGASQERSILALPSGKLRVEKTPSCFEVDLRHLEEIRQNTDILRERVPVEYKRLCQKPMYH